MVRRALLRIIAFTPLVILLGVIPQAAHAADQGLEISPPLIEADVTPGTTQTVTIKLRNITSSPIVAVASIDDFAAKGEDGLPQILDDDNGTHSIRRWFSSIPSIPLAPQEIKTISVVLTPPADVEPGSHYGVVRFTPTAPGESPGVSLSASIGTLVLAKVPGEITNNTSLIEFSLAPANRVGSSLFEKGPVTLIERFQNTGSVHVKPKGVIVITDMRDKEVATIPLNPQGGSVLPDSIRKYSQNWNMDGAFGKYTAHLRATYEDGSPLAETSLSFWIVPYRALGWSLLALIATVTALILLLNQYKRRILKNAGHR